MGKHPAFNEGHTAQNLLATELDACVSAGIDPDVYFLKPRDTRIAFVAHHVGKNFLGSMQMWDEREKQKRETKNRKGRG